MNCIGQQQKEEHRRLCDFCGESTALLYCKADSAKLCLPCDREVHSTNQLFAKHTRWLLCDACDSTPATIFCCTDGSVFCQNCDFDTHNANRSVHDRRPLEGFGGCPSVTELLGILGFEDVGKKALLFGDLDGAPAGCGPNENSNEAENVFAFSDLLVWETPSVVTLDDLIMSNTSSTDHNFQAMGVPPLPKNRNATCGQHKEEILCQLHEMSKLEPISGDEGDVETLIGFQSLVPGQNHQLGQKDEIGGQNREPELGSSFEVSAFQQCGNAGEVADHGFSSALLGSYIEMNHVVRDKDSDVGDSSGNMNGSHEEQSCPPALPETIQMLPRVPIRELNSQERDSAISRYKEKKKTRRFEKHIRYESRKVRAESRTRIRGRFAKMGH